MRFILATLYVTCALWSNAQFTSIQQSITNTFEFAEINESQGLALIGGIRVAASGDGGFTWNELPLGNFGFLVNGMVYHKAVIISPTEFCLMGRNQFNGTSIVIRTINGGATWSSVLSSADDFLDMDANGSTIIVAGEDGMHRSLNGGATWSPVPSLGSGTFDQVEYNTVSGTWMAHKVYFDMFQSNDNGQTWNSTAITWPGPLALTRHIGTNGDKFTNLGTNGQVNGAFTEFNNSYSFTDNIGLNGDYLQGLQIQKAFYLPSNDVIVQSYAYLAKLQQNGLVFYYDHNLIEAGGTNPVQITDFEMGQTYGLAVGMLGGVSRFDPTQTEDLYLPTGYSLTSTQCPGEVLTASMVFDYGDSIQWYYNGNPVSNDPGLNYTTPIVFGQHTLSYSVWVDTNVTNSGVSTITFNPLNDPSLFQFTADSTVCLGGQVFLFADELASAGFGLDSMFLYQDNQLIHSTNNPNDYGQWITNITDTIDFQLITTLHQTCGVTTDTINFTIEPFDDLSDDYFLLPGDSIYCSGDQHFINMSNVDSTYSYFLEGTSGWNGTYNSGNNDSLFVTGPVSDINWLPLSIGNQNYPEYFEITISDTNGCTQGPFPLDTIYTSRANAVPSVVTLSHYVGDTLMLENLFPANNPTWTAQAPLTVVNPNDFVPIIYGDSTGFFEVSLVNEPLPGCIDSATIIVHYADSLSTDMVETCEIKPMKSSMKIHNFKYDTQGNMIVIGAYRSYPNWWKPTLQLTKLGPAGDTLWHVEAPELIGGVDRHKAVITDFEIDDNGDIVCLISINSEISYSYDLINITTPTGGLYSHCYVVRYNGQTGAMEWATELTSISPFDNSSLINTYDLMLHDGLMHFTLGRQQGFFFGAINQSGGLEFVNSISSAWLKPINFLGHTSAPSMQENCYLTPEFRKLPNGEIIMAGYVKPSSNGGISYQGSHVPEFAMLDECFFVAKYDPTNGGLSDFKVLAEAWWGNNNFNFDVDEESNITAVVSWQNDASPRQIGDSIVSLEDGTAIIQIDEDFNQNWIAIGEYSTQQELDIAEATGEIILTGRAYRKMMLQRGDSSLMVGTYPPLNPPLNAYPEDMFLMSISKDGFPQAVEWLDLYVPGFPNSYQSQQNSQLHTLVNPCGEITSILNRIRGSQVNIGMEYIQDGIVQAVDSSLILRFSDICNSAVCNYISPLEDQTFCTNLDTLFVDSDWSFQVDSVDFYVLSNGTIIDTLTQPFDDGFEVPAYQQSGTLEVQVFSPNTDTLLIDYYPPIAASYTYDADICNGEAQVIQASPATNSYTWPGGSQGTGFSFNSGVYMPGLNNIEVQAVDSNNCVLLDTLSITVNVPTTPTFDSLYLVNCNNDLLVTYNDMDYSSASWFINGVPTSIPIPASQMSVGYNLVTVDLEDNANSCDGTFEIIVEYCNASLTDANVLDIVLYPNPVDDKFTVRANGIVGEVTYTLTTNLGQILDEGTFDLSHNIEYHFDSNPGTYFLTIENELGKRVFKVVKL